MVTETTWNEGSGVRIWDLDERRGFVDRGVPLSREAEEAAFAKLRSAISESAEAALNELVQMAVSYCHADSAGISLEEEGPNGGLQFRWVAVAGSFQQYLNGTTPRFYSPCGTTLDRGVSQRYEVSQPYYNFLGVTAEPILDGLLIPWHSATRQGTLWMVAHRAQDTFTESDYLLMRKLADFVSENVEDR